MGRIHIRPEALGNDYELHKVLAGFMTGPLFRRTIRPTWKAMNSGERKRALKVCRKARAARKALPPVDLTNVVLGDIPEEYRGYVDRIKANENFKRVYGSRSVSFAVVKVDNLSVFQPSVSMAYHGEQLAGDLGAIMQSCLPENFTSQVKVTTTPVPIGTQVTFTFENPNFDVTGPPQIVGGVANLNLAAHLNWVQVAKLEGRYYVKNGNHRCFVRLASGRHEVPAIVYEARDWKDIVERERPEWLPYEYLRSLARPPVIQDYLSEAAVEVPLPRTRKVLNLMIRHPPAGSPIQPAF